MKRWYPIALFNLVILAFLGLILRYKMNFSLPFIEQENLLHAHSHFAFNGWISFLLQLLIVDDYTRKDKKSVNFWNTFFLVSSVVNYGMIISFLLLGYTTISIILSTVAMWLSYVFAWRVYKAIPKAKNVDTSVLFTRASLFFLVLSSLGPYAIAGMEMMKVGDQYWFHNALYFFLHFQYNGWFTFAVLSFLIKKLEQSAAYQPKHARMFFLLLAFTCIPSYLFTSLWHHRPLWVDILVVITVVVQLFSLYYLWKLLYQNKPTIFLTLPVACRWLYTLAVVAFILKQTLQFVAVYPSLTQYAFGIRSIVIGYLHLVFLGFVSMYLLGLMVDKQIISTAHKLALPGIILFAAGIIINEILLGVQGFAAIDNMYLPPLNFLLFINTFTLVTGASLLFVARRLPVTISKNISTKNYEYSRS